MVGLDVLVARCVMGSAPREANGGAKFLTFNKVFPLTLEQTPQPCTEKAKVEYKWKQKSAVEWHTHEIIN